ncbi:MAG: WbqC family protein [Bacteroidales bacterium]|nr:WbqC family protein [Bacteroidales bacterium]MBP5517977.1 WbqC family protein [Bacteroidales bacterium]
MLPLLSTAYLPPVDYFAAIAKYGGALIEACENYQKQSYRNRCTILTANGKMNLNIPVARGGDNFTHSVPIKDIQIDYQENWPVRHIRAMEAAYMNSPFYEYYIDDISAILLKKEKSLFALNQKLTELLLGFCGIKAEISLTTEFVADYGELDFRSRIHPKSKLPSLMKEWKKEKPWWQVFARQGFVPNLSIVDLLFNEGPNAISFLV